MKRILLIEDDAPLGRGICLALSSGEQEMTLCRTLAQGRQALAEGSFDLLILDVNLPDGSGLDLLTQLRAVSRLPVLMLTANDLESDQVAGLELGADDYVTKPFSLAILRARVNRLLRRTLQPDGAVELPPFSFDFSAMVFLRDGQPLELSKTEQRLLRLLVEHRGRTLTREQLLSRVWDGGDFVDENALSVAVRRLRSKLTDAPIKTVYGLGYTWEVK
nr:response regulator transcription factor [uncultured Dysosmobacter sp.]